MTGHVVPAAEISGFLAENGGHPADHFGRDATGFGVVDDDPINQRAEFCDDLAIAFEVERAQAAGKVADGALELGDGLWALRRLRRDLRAGPCPACERG